MKNFGTDKKNPINIAFIFDDGFVIPTATAITSLIENKNKDTEINLYLITSKLSAENVEIFKEFKKHKKININIINIDDSFDEFKISKNGFHVSPAAIIKFKLPEVLNALEKVLYIDGDTIIQNDLSALYNTNIENEYAAAVLDARPVFQYKPSQLDKLDIKHHSGYFNSGVMLLNLKKMRTDNISEKLFNYRKNGINFFMDQDALNVVFEDKVVYIHVNNNLQVTIFENFTYQEIYKYHNISYIDESDIIKNANIIHYCSKYKPWLFENTILQDVWLKYFEKSPIKNMKLKKDKLYTENFIVSLTSFPARINTVHQTIETILNQSLKPEKVVLWLNEMQFPNKEKDLPEELLSLRLRNLDIEWLENKDNKSYKKLIPALLKYPEKIIVTADDDILYPYDWLEKLYNAYKKNPTMIHCHRAHRVGFKNKKLLPYNKWLWEVSKLKPSYNNFLTGVGGVLYPSNCLYKDVLKEKLFTKLSPRADDIWFWAMAVLNGTKINVIKDNISHLNYVEGTQEGECLWKTNCGENQNDIQLQNVLKYYPKILKRLDKSKFECDTNSFLENIFSVKNNFKKDKKIVTIMGIKIKIKNKKLKKIFSITSHKSHDNKWHRIIWVLGIRISFRNRRKEMEEKLNYLEQQNRVLSNSLNEQKIILEQQNKDFTDSKISIQNIQQEFNRKLERLNSDLKKLEANYIYKLHKYCPENKRAEALKDWYYEQTGEQLNLDNPQTFNEKIQWLKLYDSTPIKTRLADKYLVRDWVSKKIGEQYLIPLLGVWDSFDEIDFDKLPNQFVLKCNHGSGYNIIVTDKSKLDIEDAKRKINTWMNENFAFKAGFEMHYSDIPRKIIAEEYIENNGNDLYDYKFWCFNGEVKYMQFRDGFGKNLKMVFYDLDWNVQPFLYDHELYTGLQKPAVYSQMINIARNLCKGFSFVCVDLYLTKDNKIKFGELTFTRSSGIAKWNDNKYNLMFGQMIKLPAKKAK